jgi:hypothetical protein
MTKKVKTLDDKAYAEFIKELVGEEKVDLNEPQKKD